MSIQISKTSIHPTAIIDPEVEIGSGVIVGPFSIIEKGVRIGNGTRIGSHVVIEGNTTLGEENTYGAMAGRAAAGPLTYARVSTDDVQGLIRAYTGEGELTDDPLDTFGHRAVAHVPNLQDLMKYVCKNGFEHHVAMTMGHVSATLDEAFTTYMGWESHNHTN